MTGTNTTQRQKATATNDNSEHVVVVVFTLNRPFYPTTSSAVPSVSFLILHPREIQINSVVTDSGTEKNQTLNKQGRRIKCLLCALQQLYRVREHNKKNATRELRPTYEKKKLIKQTKKKRKGSKYK